LVGERIVSISHPLPEEKTSSCWYLDNGDHVFVTDEGINLHTDLSKLREDCPRYIFNTPNVGFWDYLLTGATILSLEFGNFGFGQKNCAGETYGLNGIYVTKTHSGNRIKIGLRGDYLSVLISERHNDDTTQRRLSAKHAKEMEALRKKQEEEKHKIRV
jgi:hypothetical protein